DLARRQRHGREVLLTQRDRLTLADPVPRPLAVLALDRDVRRQGTERPPIEHGARAQELDEVARVLVVRLHQLSTPLAGRHTAGLNGRLDPPANFRMRLAPALLGELRSRLLVAAQLSNRLRDDAAHERLTFESVVRV